MSRKLAGKIAFLNAIERGKPKTKEKQKEIKSRKQKKNKKN
jgi:hypothetical protein